MIRSLRKGYALIELQYADTCDTIGAEKFEAEVKEGNAIFRASLRPSSEHQRQDEEYFHTHKLVSLSVNDSQILKELRSFHNAHKSEYSSWSLHLASQGEVVKFAAELSVGPSEQLQFTVLSALPANTERQ